MHGVGILLFLWKFRMPIRFPLLTKIRHEYNHILNKQGQREPVLLIFGAVFGVRGDKSLQATSFSRHARGLVRLFWRCPDTYSCPPVPRSPGWHLCSAHKLPLGHLPMMLWIHRTFISGFETILLSVDKSFLFWCQISNLSPIRELFSME